MFLTVHKIKNPRPWN